MKSKSLFKAAFIALTSLLFSCGTASKKENPEREKIGRAHV